MEKLNSYESFSLLDFQNWKCTHSSLLASSEINIKALFYVGWFECSQLGLFRYSNVIMNLEY